MTAPDPLALEMRLQAFRVLAGSPGAREQLCARLSTEGMRPADLEVLIGYCSDQGREPQGLLFGILRDPMRWRGYVDDLRASATFAGSSERQARANGSSGDPSTECIHGVVRPAFCDRCYPSGPTPRQRIESGEVDPAATLRVLGEGGGTMTWAEYAEWSERRDAEIAAAAAREREAAEDAERKRAARPRTADAQRRSGIERAQPRADVEPGRIYGE